MMLYAAGVQSSLLRAQQTANTSLITLGSGERVPRHPITLEEVLALREAHEPRLSPNGAQMAFLVRQAFRECNCYRTALYVTATRGTREPRKLLEEEFIANVRWTPDGRFISYLSTRGGSRQVWRVAFDGGVAEPVLVHMAGASQNFAEAQVKQRDTARVGVDYYEWSPDGSQLAFTTTPATDSLRVQRLINGGVLYDPARMFLFNILRKQWTREPTELWMYNARTRVQRRVWQAPRAGAMTWTPISSFAWSLDGRRIVVSYAAGMHAQSSAADPSEHIGVLDLRTEMFSPLVTAGSTFARKPEWSPDGSRVAFVASGNVFLSTSGAQSSLGIVNVSTGEIEYVARGAAIVSITRLWWQHTHDGSRVVFEATSPGDSVRARSGLYEVELTSHSLRRITPNDDHMSDCSTPVGGRTACVLQASNVPPAPAVVDLRSGTVGLAVTINPELRDIALSAVSEIRWANKFGAATNGYLILPSHYDPAKRYPLVVILYHFEGRFVTAAEWLTSYPAQVFAQKGMVVLLWNYPRWEGWKGHDFPRASIATAYSPLSSLEAAVELLARQGLVDSARVGLMGFSMGGFWAAFAATHSALFHVVSIGNASDFNPGSYWLWGSQSMSEFYEQVYEGPPYGPTAANWSTFAPALNAQRVRGPALLEYNDEEALFGMEFLTALRRYNVPVEFVIYPDDGHVFLQPVHRLASMRRNLEWFSFWLLGEEETDPAAREQYDRWRAMRPQARRLEASASHAAKRGVTAP